MSTLSELSLAQFDIVLIKHMCKVGGKSDVRCAKYVRKMVEKFFPVIYKAKGTHLSAFLGLKT